MIKTGEVIQINDAANDGMQSLTVYGNTRQNLWVNPATRTSNGVTLTANDNGSVTLSGTATANIWITVQQYSIRPSTTYTLSASGVVSGGTAKAGFYVSEFASDGTETPHLIDSGETSATFTTKADCVRTICGFLAYSGAIVSGTYRVMLNEGSEAQPWCPPGLNGVDELSIVTTGKNIVSVGEASSLNFQLIDYFLPAGTYTISVLNKPEGTAFNLRAPRALGIGTADDNVVSAAKDTVTFTLEYASPIFFNGYGSSLTTPLQLQLELGSTATAYEPPSVTTTLIDLDGHTLNSLPDGTRDELHIDSTGKVTLVKRTQTLQLDDRGSWGQNENPFLHYTAPSSAFGGSNTGLGPNGTIIKGRCDKLPADTTVPNGIYSAGVNGSAAYLREPTFADDASGVKAWMGANTPTVIMPLATPQEVELPYVSMPKLKKRTPTVIFAASTVPAEMELDYRRWRQGADGFRVGRRHSFWTEGQCIASSNSGAPEKKSSTKTVPYMSGFYDFSAVYGAVAFESRELQYRFEMVGEDMADLQEQKSALLNWVATIQDQDIYDDTVPGRHYRGSFDSADWEEGDEGESGALDVTFLCQPFLIDDDYTTAQCPVGTTTVTNGGESVNPTAVPSDGTATVKINGAAQQISAETRLSIQLAPGDNEVEVSGSDVTLKWLRATL